uniref:2,3-bisphosphoglycerate-independent phosphoglycerate mutase n=1 Tax=Leiomenia cribrosa TaxID=217483 RepID=A0A4D6WUM3_9FLOR|nr:Phosphoglycerate mutase [Leiomenia cribrosa]
MQQQSLYPIVLTILDGWGHSDYIKGNAIKLAQIPVMDKLWKTYPNTLLDASGIAVGLPENQMGNSEVGHTTIGAGRTINQDLVRISKSIQTKTFFKNHILNEILKKTVINSSKLHLIGLCSDGGVHSHIKHLIALIEISKIYKIETCIHVMTDGRDTSPYTAKIFIKEIIDIIGDAKNINICTISGRYYSMDRDCRWSRTEKSYKILISNIINSVNDPMMIIDQNYKNNISDEFIPPTRIYPGNIIDNDSIIFFNFRPDRIRQLLHCFAKNNFKGFNNKIIKNLNIATFTRYDVNIDAPVIFPPQEYQNFIGEILSKKGLKQFRLAETEKYAHVTYFFNGGIEEPFPGEDRELISSPNAETYDLTPKMSAGQLTDSLIKAIKKNYYQFIVINYANPDMVGHTGNLNATIEAVNYVDKCIEKVFQQIQKVNGTLIITADHGNADYMINKENKPCTSHSTNPVPFMLINNQLKSTKINLRKNGCLADIAPTILELLNIKIPSHMNGKSLIENYNEILNNVKKL